MAKRRKRLFPKKYSADFIPTPRIDPAKAAAYNLQRSKATVGPRGDTEHKLDNSFMQEIPQTRKTIRYKRIKLADGRYRLQAYFVPNEKYNTEQKAHQVKIVEDLRKDKDLFGLYKVWQSGFRNQGVTEYNRMYLEKRDDYSFMVFFAGDQYLFVQEVPDKNIRRISRTYQVQSEMYSEAVRRKNSADIAWIVLENLKS